MTDTIQNALNLDMTILPVIQETKNKCIELSNDLSNPELIEIIQGLTLFEMNLKKSIAKAKAKLRYESVKNEKNAHRRELAKQKRLEEGKPAEGSRGGRIPGTKNKIKKTDKMTPEELEEYKQKKAEYQKAYQRERYAKMKEAYKAHQESSQEADWTITLMKP